MWQYQEMNVRMDMKPFRIVIENNEQLFAS